MGPLSVGQARPNFHGVGHSFVKRRNVRARCTAGNTSAPPVISLTIDRPFLLLIRDHATGAVLFMGRVSDPS